jgi:hypothetical protein
LLLSFERGELEVIVVPELQKLYCPVPLFDCNRVCGVKEGTAVDVVVVVVDGDGAEEEADERGCHPIKVVNNKLLLLLLGVLETVELLLLIMTVVLLLLSLLFEGITTTTLFSERLEFD